MVADPMSIPSFRIVAGSIFAYLLPQTTAIAAGAAAAGYWGSLYTDAYLADYLLKGFTGSKDTSDMTYREYAWYQACHLIVIPLGTPRAKEMFAPLMGAGCALTTSVVLNCANTFFQGKREEGKDAEFVKIIVPPNYAPSISSLFAQPAASTNSNQQVMLTLPAQAAKTELPLPSKKNAVAVNPAVPQPKKATAQPDSTIQLPLTGEEVALDTGGGLLSWIWKKV